MAERPETCAVAIDFRDAVKAQITQAVLAALLFASCLTCG
jgi:hypothetical protein